MSTPITESTPNVPTQTVFDYLIEIKKTNNMELYNDVYGLVLEHGIKINDDFTQILYSAIGSGNITIANLFLQKGFKIDETSASMRKAMKDIMMNKCTESLKFVMQNANIQNILIDDTMPAIHYIVKLNWLEAVVILCDAKIDLEIKNKNDETILWTASCEKHEPIMKILLDHGANPNVEKNGQKLISYLFCNFYTRRKDHVSLLLAVGAKIHDIDTCMNSNRNKTALFSCIDSNEISNINFLVENGYDVDTMYDKTNAFLYALAREKFDIVKLLLPHCKKFPKFGKNESNALWYCIDKKYLDIAKLLIEKKEFFDINSTCKDGRTSLRIALASGLTEIADLLIKAGADINIRGCDLNSGLMKAVDNNSTETSMLAIKNGAKTDFQDPDGDTALMFAIDHGNNTIVKALLEAGADPNIQNKSGETALMSACKNNLVVIVTLLLSHNASIHIKNTQGKTALDLVSHNKELIDLLTQYQKSPSNSNENESEPKYLMDDKGNVYEPIASLFVSAICEKTKTAEFPKSKIIQYPIADIVYRSYNDELKMWSEYETHKHDSTMEIQFVESDTVKFHVLSSSKVKIQFNEVCVPNGETYKFKYI